MMAEGGCKYDTKNVTANQDGMVQLLLSKKSQKKEIKIF
jgi:hypothetical protein